MDQHTIIVWSVSTAEEVAAWRVDALCICRVGSVEDEVCEVDVREIYRACKICNINHHISDGIAEDRGWVGR